MKRLFLVLTLAAAMVFGSAAFAQDTDFKQRPPREKGQQHNQYDSDRKEQLKNLNIQLKEKKHIIQRQQSEIKNLRQQLESQIKLAKTRIYSLKSQKRSIDPSQISAIKQTLNSIGQAHKMLNSTQEAVQGKNNDLRSARRNRRPEAFLQALDDIIDIQQKRIDALSRIISDLNKLNSQLN